MGQASSMHFAGLRKLKETRDSKKEQIVVTKKRQRVLLLFSITFYTVAILLTTPQYSFMEIFGLSFWDKPFGILFTLYASLTLICFILFFLSATGIFVASTKKVFRAFLSPLEFTVLTNIFVWIFMLLVKGVDGFSALSGLIWPLISLALFFAMRLNQLGMKQCCSDYSILFPPAAVLALINSLELIR